jgi:alcohol dehydrogenase class IV
MTPNALQSARPFVAPARVVAAVGASSTAGAELRAAGIRPSDGALLVVTDEAVQRLGLFDGIRAALEEEGFSLALRPPINSEPTPAAVEALILDDETAPVAAVIAVGGGSALDAAKLAALATANPGLDLSSGISPAAAVNPAPPLLAIPTTAGTGAEATAVGMLWNRGAKVMFVHPQLVPRLAILDPLLLLSLPPAVTAAGGLDAVSHSIESLLSTFSTELTRIAALSALRLLASSLSRAHADPSDVPARQGTLIGAYLAGLGLNASVVLGHSLAYVIAAEAGLPHGVSCAMALPYCLAHARPACEEDITQMARIVTDDPEARADDLIQWLVDRNDEMGIPGSLSAVGVANSRLGAMAQQVVEGYPRPNHPVSITQPDVEELLTLFHDGTPLNAWDKARSHR